MTEPNRRAVIEEAWEKAEAEAKDDAPEVKEPEDKLEVKEPPVDEPEDKTPEPAAKKPVDEYKEEKKADEVRQAPEPRPEPVHDSPPGSWKPAQREQWAKIPADVRAEITRREMLVQKTLSETDNIRKFATDFADIVQPYAHVIRQSGSTPLRAVQALMGFGARMMSPNQDEKARALVEIIGNYGVDIRALDAALTPLVKDGRVPSQQVQPEQPPQWARPMFDFMQTVQQSREQAVARQRQEAENEIRNIAGKPFFEDVREDMADIMELGARRGRKVSLEEAYKQAISQNPEINAIMEQRRKAEGVNSVSAAASTLARARRASSTVTGAPSGSKIDGKAAPKTRREAIEAAWEEQAGG